MIPNSQKESQQRITNKLINIIDQKPQSISFMGQSHINDDDEVSVYSNDDDDENIDAELI